MQLFSQSELVADQSIIISFAFGQLAVCPLLDHSPVIQNNNLISALDGTQPVGHNDNRFLFEQPVEFLHDNSFVDRVQRVGRFVEHQIGDVLISRPGNQYPLLLPGTQPVAVDADLGVIPQRQGVDKLLDVGDMRRLSHAIRIGIGVRQPDIPRNGVRKDKPLLHHNPATVAPGAVAVSGQRDVIQQNLARGRSIEAEQQLEQGSHSDARAQNTAKYS